MSALQREARRRAAPPQCPVRPAEKPCALACCTLPAEEWAVSHARNFTKVKLAAWQISEEVADAARLVVTEFVTNTVRHSGSAEVGLRLARSDSTVWIEVFDSGLWRTPASSEPDDVAECGRGFHLVDALARRCGIHSTPSGTCAWAMLPESPPPGRQEAPTASLSPVSPPVLTGPCARPFPTARMDLTEPADPTAHGPNGHEAAEQRRDGPARAH